MHTSEKLDELTHRHPPTGVQLGSTQVPRLNCWFAAPAAQDHLSMSLLEGLPRMEKNHTTGFCRRNAVVSTGRREGRWLSYVCWLCSYVCINVM